MAFATSNIRPISLGSVSGVVGDFTASKGDADGTYSVGGSRIYLCKFNETAGATPVQQAMPYTLSTNSTTGITTVTVNCSSGATAGRFIIIYG